MKNILIAGNFGFGDAGSDADLMGILKKLREIKNDFSFTITSGQEYNLEDYLSVKSIKSNRLDELIDQIKKSDIVIVCGKLNKFDADDPEINLNNKYRENHFVWAEEVPFLARFLGVHCVLIGDEIWPNEKLDIANINLFQLATCYSPRNPSAIQVLKEQKQINAEVNCFVDPIETVFWVPSLSADMIFSKFQFIKPGQQIIGVALTQNKFTRSSDNLNALAISLDKLARETNLKILLIPLQASQESEEWDGVEVCRSVLLRMEEKNKVDRIDHLVHPDVISGLFNACEFVVTTESWAALCALANKKIIIGLGTDPYLAEIVESAGLSAFALLQNHWNHKKLTEIFGFALKGGEESKKATQQYINERIETSSGSLNSILNKLDGLKLGSDPITNGLLQSYIQHLLFTINYLQQRNHDLNKLLVTAREEAVEAKLAADRYTGRIAFWVQTFWNLRLRFAPPKSRREGILNRAIWWVSEIVSLRIFKKAVARMFRRPKVFEDRYYPEDFSQTTLFTNQPGLFPDYQPRKKLEGIIYPLKVSLIATVRNEKNNAADWLEGIWKQTYLPDEIIIVDAGSTDGTVELLNSMAEKSPIPILVLVEPGVNIARGRNLAIEQAKNEIVAITDFGCRPTTDWLEKIVLPFVIDPDIEVVAGWYEVLDRKGNRLNRRAWPQLHQVDPGTFIPSSRSLAVTRSAWIKAGKYPEWLTLTGEDTYFGFELKRFCSRWAFVPDAIVLWVGPDTIREYWKKVTQWSVGDGESGLGGEYYWWSCKQIIKQLGSVALVGILFLVGLLTGLWGYLLAGGILLASGIIALILIVISKGRGLRSLPEDFVSDFARVRGFLRGASRRHEIDLKRLNQTRGIFFILSGVPIYDTGGGSRATQIALEMLRQNFMVVFINRFGSYETTNVGVKIAHPNLFCYPFTKFSWETFKEQFGEILRSKKSAAMLEFPLTEFIPLVTSMKASGVHILYDLLDDWNSSLGADWYSVEGEKTVIDNADALIATAPVLAEQLKEKSGANVHLLPNAVNLRLFNHRREYNLPAELDPSKLKIIYTGALWGDWFHWNLLIKVAETYSNAQVVVIGDYRGQSPRELSNLHFLGLKPQNVLPAYLSNSDVAIIPWKINKITMATSPLKLYEYLAMRIPVVAPDLPLLKGIPLVYTSINQQSFLENISLSQSVNRDDPLIDTFLEENCWQTRIAQIANLAGIN